MTQKIITKKLFNSQTEGGRSGASYQKLKPNRYKPERNTA